MKKFTVMCDFQGGKSPFDFYIGLPESGHHPIFFQSTWLSSARGGSVPSDIMDSLQKLATLAKENEMDFEELCFYAMSNANQEKTDDTVQDPIPEPVDQGEDGASSDDFGQEEGYGSSG